MIPSAAQLNKDLEPAHLIWLVSRVALVTGLVFLPILVLAPGLTFWVDLVEVIPIMWMGGMCSESMMIRMIMTGFNIAVIATTLSLARWLSHRLKMSFDHTKQGARPGLMELPGPTVWQARLHEVQFRSTGKPRLRYPLFARQTPSKA